MAKFEPSSIIKRISKSVGYETYCQTRGIQVVKSKITTNTSKTKEQRKQRVRWTVYMALAIIFDRVILIAFPERARTLTPYNSFISMNKDAVTVDDQLATEVDYAAIQCSAGRLTVPEASVTLDSEKHQLVFTHEATEYSRRAQPTDQLYAFVVEEKRQEAKLYKLNTREDTTPANASLPARWTTESLHAYVFALSENGRQASKTLYLKPE